MQSNTWTVKEILKWTFDYFDEKKIDSPRTTAELLLSKAMHLTRMKLYLNHEQPLTENELKEYKAYIKRAASGEPVQYIVGRQEFYSLNFKVTPDVLIPRPDTETLVELLIDDVRKREAEGEITILEIGTGSGAISVTVAHELKDKAKLTITAVDVSEEALKVARENAKTNGGESSIEFVRSDMFENIAKGRRYDYIVSNPPYIAKEFYDNLDRKVKDFEPKIALYGGVDGLKFYEEIFLKGYDYLKEDGKILVEIDFQKKGELKALIDKKKYSSARFHNDLSGRERVLEMQRAASR